MIGALGTIIHLRTVDGNQPCQLIGHTIGRGHILSGRTSENFTFIKPFPKTTTQTTKPQTELQYVFSEKKGSVAAYPRSFRRSAANENHLQIIKGLITTKKWTLCFL